MASLELHTSDSFEPLRTITVSIRARPIDYETVDFVQEPAVMGQSIPIVTVMDDFVKTDSLTVHVREGGAPWKHSERMTLLQADPVNDQYRVFIPGSLVTSRGVEFFLKAWNGPVVFSDPNSDQPKRYRVQIPDLVLPPGTAGAYRMISFPFDLCGANLLRDVLSDDLTSEPSQDWRLFVFETGNQEQTGYSELSPDNDREIRQGEAYWLITRDKVRLHTSPAVGISTPTDSTFAILLEPGWNLVGNPFNFSVGWSDVLVASGMSPSDTTLESPWRWIARSGNHGEYSNDLEALVPFEGSWVKNNSQEPVVLRVPPLEWTSFPLEREPILPLNADEAGWRVRISASVQEHRDPVNLVGASADASPNRDRWDRSDPPPTPGPSLSLYFPCPDPQAKDRRSVDIRPAVSSEDAPRSQGYLWHFDVAKSFVVNGSIDTVTLRFRELDCIPQHWVAILSDLTLGRTVKLGDGSQYQFLLGKKGYVTEDEARFMLLVGTEDYITTHPDRLASPTQTGLLQIHPNPLRVSSVIRYQLAWPVETRIRIYDVLGRLVRNLESRGQPCGRYEILWNGVDQNGRMVPSGTYFLKMEAGEYSKSRRIVVIR
jgi:hypothetical protein